MSTTEHTNRTSVRFISFAVTFALALSVGCVQVGEMEPVEDRVTVDEFIGTQDSKADGIAPTQHWAVYEQEGHDGLVARDAVGQVLLDAQIVELDESFVTVNFNQPAQCSIQFDVATSSLLATDCDMAATSLIGAALAPLHDDATNAGVLGAQSGKADGFITKAACVVGGIGVAGVGLAAAFAASMAAAPVGIVAAYGWGSVATWLGGLGGVAALCYEGFTGPSEPELTECVADCDGASVCVDACITTNSEGLDALTDEERAATRTALLGQCVRGCDEDSVCASICVDTLTN